MDTINGLPAHVLLVHLVVIIIPLTSLAAVLGSLWPAARRKLSFLTPLGALVGLIAVPITISAGRTFATRLRIEEAIENHMTLGSRMLPVAIALFVTTAAQWAYFQFLAPRRWATIALAVLVIASAITATILVALTGESGARAVWGGL